MLFALIIIILQKYIKSSNIIFYKKISIFQVNKYFYLLKSGLNIIKILVYIFKILVCNRQGIIEYLLNISVFNS